MKFNQIYDKDLYSFITDRKSSNTNSHQTTVSAAIRCSHPRSPVLAYRVLHSLCILVSKKLAAQANSPSANRVISLNLTGESRNTRVRQWSEVVTFCNASRMFSWREVEGVSLLKVRVRY